MVGEPRLNDVLHIERFHHESTHRASINKGVAECRLRAKKRRWLRVVQGFGVQ
jgi:hypothetical protein